MNVTLYKYTGDREKVDKSSDLIFILTATGQFKAETSVLSPTLLLSIPLEGDEFLTDEDGNLIADVIVGAGDDSGQVRDFNYFYIEEFRRYYYLSSLIVSSTNLLVISGVVDPLYSFKDEILANTAMIDRNENEYNPLLIDDMRPISEVADIEIENVSDLISFAWNGISKNCFIATLVKPFRDIPSNPMEHEFPPLSPDVATSWSSPNPDIDTRILTQGTKNSGLYAANIEYLEEFGQYVLYDETYDNNVISAVAYPFSFSIANEQSSDEIDTLIYLWDSYITPFKLPATTPDKIHEENILADNQVWRLTKGGTLPYLDLFRGEIIVPSPSSFLELQPYTLYELYIPFVGYIELNPRNVGGHKLSGFYSLNLYDGTGTFTLFDNDEEMVICNSNVSMGVRIDFTKTNVNAIRNQILQRGVSLALSTLTAIVAVSGGAASGNYVSAAVAGAGAVANIGNSAAALSVASQRGANQGGISGPTSYANPLKPFLKKTRLNPLFADGSTEHTEYLHLVGAPLLQPRALSSLSGYTRVSHIHLHDCGATDMEKAEITSLLKNGVIL